ncbi:MAG: DUF4412 domain-containing protein [Desulfobacterales bacterium]|nr:DUF4412 domain-containing protein [Desulfobacterales bacterium]
MSKHLVNILIMAFALVWLITHGEAFAAQKSAEFSGDIVITEPGSTIKGKIYVKNPYIRRVEMSKEAGGIIYIRPPEARGKIWMLDPIKKQYIILSAGFPARKAPVEAWLDMRNDMCGALKGEEMLNGYSCTIYHFNYKDQDKIAVKMWFAEDLQYTSIKIEADAKLAIGIDENSKFINKIMRGTFEILNIKIENLDDALFEIPSDYVEVK